MVLRLGIDVGGTNTDAAILDGRRVLAGVKRMTTEDVTAGISEALEAVIAEAGIARDAVDLAMIGTTHFTNAIVQRCGIDPVAVIRLGLPATACLPPMVDWPDELRAEAGDHVWLLHGGHEFDGREISALDETGLARAADEIAEKGLRVAAISSVFSPINSAMEDRAREILAERVPGLRIVLSSEIGRIGLLERESAAIMNASLLTLADRTISAFSDALVAAGLTCPFYVTQNDGTLMAADMVRRFPVLTFASGPTNSMRGAAFLTGAKEAIVVDIGGTTTDVGALNHGFPRPAATVVDVGGVRTNFRMPDVFSVALGGGTIVRGGGGDPTLGPDSVGYRLTEAARVFGGDTLTATDIAVASGMADIGDPARVGDLDPTLLAAARGAIADRLERAVERSRTSPEPVPVICVGGGSMLAPDRIGALEVTRPAHFAVANAVGAAIAQISGEVDRVFALDGTSREACLADAETEARAGALAAGAADGTIEVIEREDVPLAYLPGNATRIHVKVVGEMEGIDA